MESIADLPPVAFELSVQLETRTIPIIFWDIRNPYAMKMNHLWTSFATNNITAQPADCTIVVVSIGRIHGKVLDWDAASMPSLWCREELQRGRKK
jgi:hypothetical protein